MKCVLVTGGRDYRDSDCVFETLDELKPDLVIEGGAIGADELVRKWAEAHGIHYGIFPANWAKRGKAAGPMRNAIMVKIVKALESAGWECIVVAFPGGRGTASCVSIAVDANLHIRRILDEK
jgi:hypothetical protein